MNTLDYKDYQVTELPNQEKRDCNGGILILAMAACVAVGFAGGYVAAKYL